MYLGWFFFQLRLLGSLDTGVIMALYSARSFTEARGVGR